MIETGHSRFPVYEGKRDNVIGILMAKDLLKLQRSPELNLRTLLRPAVFVPETKRLNELLRDFRSNRNHLAIVIDEFGNTAGLITIEDVLEEIVGEIEDEFDEKDGETGIYTLADGSQRVAGDVAIDAVNEAFGTRACRATTSTPSAASSRTSSAACRGAASGDRRRPRFSVMLTRGGAVRWFQVTRAPEAALGSDGAEPARPGMPPRAGAAPGATGRVADACAPAAHRRAARGARLRAARRAAEPGLRPHRGVAGADRRRRAARLARRPGGAAARRVARLRVRLRLARRRHLVALRQHAPLRRPAGVAGGARGRGAVQRARALPGRRAGGVRALAQRRACATALLFGALWLLAELARGVIFTGFPWLACGFSQIDAPLAAWRRGSGSTASAVSPRPGRAGIEHR